MFIQSVSIYFDKKKNVIIFPIWRDEDGIPRQSMKFVKLNFGYNETELGKEILDVLETSRINEYEDTKQNAWKEASNLNTWKKFQKNYETVKVDLFENKKWNLAKYRKLKDGSFGLEKGDEEKYSREYTEPLTVQQLGHIVLEMLKIK
ncbi:hypothetical protein [[Clostridium] polysaccharolyticum]|uniref:Uncharacterized protein n=1 Tax=[Clostridium] polysaccharolyticum TaxID=29364 RepID=A0A1I0DW44_9FIRM|nr:hypothetical protein [[Clostridium] polysaccharolyticum]SET36714.1 hypothetical protein SAMN04487772_1174 [[Clostridium] polysaccharolyticum]